ncbi:carboxypeptidase C prc1 [Tritrichomonas musculus]|uniref:Carboxypeptidase C prc1 n=1 Tax=Tritrichomonas musculus TaxID=1915356 RepID=A0ABR2KA56_9EUKA
MKIEINIEPQLEAIWRKVGFSDDEIDNEYATISKKVQDLFISILSDFTTISDNLEKKVEALESKVYHYNHLIGESNESFHVDSNQSLKFRYEQASQQLYDLRKTFSSRTKNYNSLYDILTNLFNILEIPPEKRGTFKEKGVDVSNEKIEEAANLVFELKETVDFRQKKMEVIIEELNDLHQRLRLKPVDMPETLGDATLSQYEEELNYLNDIYLNSIAEKKRAISQIHQIEDFFSMKSPEFVIESEKDDNISYCDEVELDSLLKYLKELQEEKAKQAPEFIEQDKQILLDLYHELHIPTPSIQEFPELYYKTNNRNRNKKKNRNDILMDGSFDALNVLEKEIEKLARFKEETSVIRKYLLQRDRIISMSKQKPKKYLSFNQVIANEKMLTADLPIINIQLEPLLEEFERNNGTPFIWDGEEVLQTVRKENSKFKEKTGMVHSRFVSSATSKKK